MKQGTAAVLENASAVFPCGDRKTDVCGYLPAEWGTGKGKRRKS